VTCGIQESLGRDSESELGSEEDLILIWCPNGHTRVEWRVSDLRDSGESG